MGMPDAPPCNGGCGTPPPPPEGQCPGGVNGDCPRTGRAAGTGECYSFAGYQNRGVGFNGKPACCIVRTVTTCCK